MSSSLSVTGVTSAPPQPTPPVQKPQAAPAAPAQPTIAQLIDEPVFELTQQAQAGNTQAQQVLTQEQAANAPATVAAAGAAAAPGSINVVA